jgi:hypothetical protein
MVVVWTTSEKRKEGKREEELNTWNGCGRARASMGMREAHAGELRRGTMQSRVLRQRRRG